MYKYHHKRKEPLGKNLGGSTTASKPIYLLSLLMLVAIVYFGIQISGAGARLALLTEREESLLKENKEASQAISNQLSLMVLNTKVVELAFEKPQRIFYLPKNQGYVSLK